MAVSDSITLNPGIGGDSLAVDTVGGVKHTRSKVQFGITGEAQDVDADNPLPVTSGIFHAMDIADGNIAGIAQVRKFGFNLGVGTTMEDVWSVGGGYNFLAAATLLELVSDDVNDAAAGTGARTVRIYGLSASYTEQTEDIILNGTTAVATLNTYIRLHRMQVLTAGSGGTAAGTITAQVTGAGAVVAECPVGHNQTEMAIFSVPAGKTAYIFSLHASATDSATKADVGVLLAVREFGGVFSTKFNLKLTSDGTCAFQRDCIVPFRIPEKSDIVMRSVSSVSATTVVAAFNLILRDN